MAATPRSSAPTPVKSCALRRRLLPAAWLLVLLLVLGGETGAQGAGEGGGAASDEAKPATITVRYFRFDGKASAWSLYVAAPGKPGKTLRGVADEAEGMVRFAVPDEGAERLILLPSKGGRKGERDHPDRIWRRSDGHEVWLREGDARIHTAPATGAFVAQAYADSATGLHVRFHGGTPKAGELEVVTRSGRTIAVQSAAGASPRKRGFRREGDELVFLYDPRVLGGALDGDKGIYLAGDFSGWQKATRRRKWRLKWDASEDCWALRVKARRVKLGSGFKFKQRDGGWVPSGGNLIVRGREAVRLDLAGAISLDDRAEIRRKSERRGTVIVPRVLVHSELSGYRTEAPMGAVCTPEATTFRVFAPTASRVEVRIYKTATGGEAETLRLEREDRGCFAGRREGDLHGRFYTLRVDAPGTHPLREVIDPWSRCNTAHDGRGLILDLRRTDPKGFREHTRPDFREVTPDATPNSPEDAIIYEAHIRDFTIHRSAGVRRGGKYLGLTERGTRGPGGVRTGLDHLVELGVTHVQLMPFQDFDNDEGADTYNWGYMPVHFNSPEGWYATKRDDASRVTEAKRMVAALHEAGLRVILDVVYNHTSSAASFDRTAPFYFYRLRPFAESPYWNGSGCGNEMRSEAPMARRFIVDSCRYWAEEYKLDGFRFDLMGLVDRDTMAEVARAVHAVDPSLLVYGEPWTGGDTPIGPTTKGRQIGGGFGVFNDILRDAIKGGNNDGARGYIQGPFTDAVNKIKNGLEGAVNRSAGGFAADPGEVLNYVACHDNKTLFDKLAEDRGATGSLRSRMHRLATAMVLLAQGVPFLHSGQELERTKRGEHNSYNLPDRINALDWSLKSKNAETYRFIRGLIALRKRHPAFRLSTAEEILGRRLRFLPADDGVIAFKLDGKGLKGETWKETIVVFNGHRKEAALTLPEGRWTVVVDDDEAGPKPVRSGPAAISGDVTVAPVSALVLHR